MTNAEKFKEVFGFDLVDENQIDNYCPYSSCVNPKDRCLDCISKWWQSEYQDTPIIPSGEPELSSGFELGYEHGKADNNDKWLEWIEELESEIEGESQVEEIFDEDSFNSMNNEANLPEVAECESYIETDIISLHKLFAIIERKLKELGGE